MPELKMLAWHKDEKIWLGLAWGLAVFIVAFRHIEDFDVFWQLQSGKFIIETGQFLYKDTFSITPNAFRLEHCWLSDIIFYLHYLAGGYELLSLLKTVIIAALGILLYRWNLQRGGNPYIVLSVLALCMSATVGSWLERPQLWTFLISITYLHILHKGREKGSKAWYLLIPLMLVWANLHAGCIFGFVLVGLFFAGEIFRLASGETTRAKTALLFSVGLATFGVAFINPYGSIIPMHILSHLNLTRLSEGQKVIMEWLPPVVEQVPLFYAVFLLWGIILVAKWKKNDPAEIIMFCAFLYMGTSQVRHSVFVPLLAGFYLPVSFQDVVRRFSPEFEKISLFKMSCKYCAVIALTLFLSVNVTRLSWGWGISPVDYPIAATKFFERNKLPPTMYNFYDWGGYLMWMLYPGYSVFVDGRNTNAETLEASNRIDNSWKGWVDDFNHFGVNSVITRTCYYDTGGPVPLVDSLAISPDWALVYRDEIAVIFLRKDQRFRGVWEKYGMPSEKIYETMYSESKRLLLDNPKRKRVHLAVARSSLKLGRYSEALHHYSQHLIKNPDDSESRMMVNFLTPK